MTTLILVAHPHLADSTSQAFLQASQPTTGVRWEHLDAQKTIEVAQEQAQLLAADRIILQFPLYWYAAPASLKHWLDTVLTRRFVYGDQRYPLAGKELGVVVTTGMPAKAFQRGGAEGFSLDALLTPLAAVAQRARMTWLPIFPIYQLAYLTEPQKLQLVMDYQRYLTQPQPDSLAQRQAWFQAQLPAMLARLAPQQRAQGELLAATFAAHCSDLAELNDTLQMIKETEDD